MRWKPLSSGLLPGLVLLALAVLLAYWIAPASDPWAVGTAEEIILFDPPDGPAAYWAAPGSRPLPQFGARDRALSRGLVAELRATGRLDPSVIYYVLLALGEGDQRIICHVELPVFQGSIHYARQASGGQLALALGPGERPIWIGTVEELMAAILDTLARPRGTNPEVLP